jgi:hypothetical protein
MRIELKIPNIGLPQIQPIAAYDAEEDDVRSILIDVCRALELQGSFIVSGFGQDRWPVDIGVDLPVLLEQLPDVLIALESKQTAIIDFYEQGIERVISFSFRLGICVATCTSNTSWQPSVASEIVEKPVEMLLDVRNEFMRAFSAAAPSLVDHPWVIHWLIGCCAKKP